MFSKRLLPVLLTALAGCAPAPTNVYKPYILEGTTQAKNATRIVGNGTNFHQLRNRPTIALSSDMKTTARVLEQYGDTLVVVDRPLGNGTTQSVFIVAP